MKTAPLVRISLRNLVNGDPVEEDTLWKACCDLGFFYLDMRMGRIQGLSHTTSQVDEGTVDGDVLLEEADKLFDFMKDLFALLMEEKIKYDLKEKGIYFGYKGMGTGIIDKAGTRDRNEYWNVSKNDMLSLSPPQPNPSIINPYRSLFTSYMTHAHAIVTLILRILNDRLGLPTSRLENWHRLRAFAGDQTRLIHSPVQPHHDRTLSNGEHTDFGSVTILFNRIGGLQVRLPPDMQPIPPAVKDPDNGDEKQDLAYGGAVRDPAPAGENWAYVTPLPGHAIINLGDALTKFSAGILHSNIHRVMAPPGLQARLPRYSLVYFSRPEDDVLLTPLRNESDQIEEAARRLGLKDDEVLTSKEWVHRMALGRRGVGKWLPSGGSDMDNARQVLKT